MTTVGIFIKMSLKLNWEGDGKVVKDARNIWNLQSRNLSATTPTLVSIENSEEQDFNCVNFNSNGKKLNRRK